MGDETSPHPQAADLTARSWSWTGCGGGVSQENVNGNGGGRVNVCGETVTSSSSAAESFATWEAAGASDGEGSFAAAVVWAVEPAQL